MSWKTNRRTKKRFRTYVPFFPKKYLTYAERIEMREEQKELEVQLRRERYPTGTSAWYCYTEGKWVDENHFSKTTPNHNVRRFEAVEPGVLEGREYLWASRGVQTRFREDVKREPELDLILESEVPNIAENHSEAYEVSPGRYYCPVCHWIIQVSPPEVVEEDRRKRREAANEYYRKHKDSGMPVFFHSP